MLAYLNMHIQDTINNYPVKLRRISPDTAEWAKIVIFREIEQDNNYYYSTH